MIESMSRNGVLPARLVFATWACAIVSGGAEAGVISGGHRLPLITLLMFCGAQTDRKTERQVDKLHFLLKERAPSFHFMHERRRRRRRSEMKSLRVLTESFPSVFSVHGLFPLLTHINLAPSVNPG